MAIDDVVRLIPPPPRPSGVGTPDEWRAVERELGLTFPADYRDFVSAYGTGMFATEYEVYNPFGGAEYLDHVRYLCRIEADFRRQLPARVPYPAWPEPGGVFPWGADQNGNYYLWLTAGPPDRWPVLTNEVRGHGYREHHCTMTEYVSGVLAGRIRPLIGGDFPGPDNFVFVGGEPPD
jgi:hypothetical protein